ncbi:hypothetical protein BDV09DRAFT_196313 [Aspergillus tetrazonus]
MSTPSPDSGSPKAAETLDIERQGTPVPAHYVKPKTLGAGTNVSMRDGSSWNIEDNTRIKSFMSKSSESEENCFAMVAHMSNVLIGI